MGSDCLLFTFNVLFSTTVFKDCILYYHTSHKFAMLKLHRPEGENSYYHPAIILTITCATLMRVQFVSVKCFISMTAQSTRVFHYIIS